MKKGLLALTPVVLAQDGFELAGGPVTFDSTILAVGFGVLIAVLLVVLLGVGTGLLYRR